MEIRGADADEQFKTRSGITRRSVRLSRTLGRCVANTELCSAISAVPEG